MKRDSGSRRMKKMHYKCIAYGSDKRNAPFGCGLSLELRSCEQ